MGITGLPGTTLYSGTSLQLTCTVILNDVVDTGVMVGAVWRRGGEAVATTNRITVSTITAVSESEYQTSLAISPLDSSADSGYYTCESVVSSSPASVFILTATTLESVSVTVAGE